MSVAAAVPDRTSCRQAGTRTTVLGGLLETTLADRRPEEGRGWQGEHEGIAFGLHERGPGPGDRLSLPYFPVADLAAAVERVRALGGEIVHPGERSVICRESEGTPFGLASSE